MTETVEEQPTVTEAPEPSIKVETPEQLLELMQILDGQDPKTVQALAKFVPDNYAAKSYLPDKRTAIAIGQLIGFGDAFFPNRENNSYNTVAEVLALGLMGYKGFKTNQYVDITRQTTDLSSLGSAPEEVKRGFLARFSGRGKE